MPQDTQSDGKLIYATVAFEFASKQDFDAFWKDVVQAYHFAEEGDFAARAFAVQKGDMFAEQSAIEDICASDLDAYDKIDAIEEAIACQDIPALLKRWEIA